MAGDINFGAIDPNAAFRGAQQTNDMLQSWAKVRAGEKLSKGDTMGAQDVLNKSGELDAAHSVQEWDVTQHERVKKLNDEKKAESAKFVSDVSGALGNVLTKDGKDAVVPAFDQLVPVLQHRGVPDEEIAMYRQQLAQDPERFLTMLYSQSQKVLERYKFMTTSDGAVVRGDVQTGNADKVYQGPVLKTVGAGTDLVQVGGDGTTGAATPPPPVPNSQQVAALVLKAFPQAQITSGQRTPEHNAAVGGVANSMHLDGEAIDMLPVPGMTYQQMADQLKQAGVPVTEALHEGEGTSNEHWHFGWRPEGQQAATGTTTLHSTPTKPADHWRAATPQEAAARGSTGGQINEVTGEFKGTDSISEAAARDAAAAKVETPKISQQAESDIAKMRQQAREASNMANLMDQFVQLNKNVETGGAMALPGAGAVVGAVNPTVSRMQSITSQITPAMRNGLPGAASDRDVAMFRSATVGLDKPYAANVATAAAGKAFAARQNDYVAFVEAYTLARGTNLGAQELWNQYTAENPLFEKKGNLLVPNKVKPWRQAITIPDGPAVGPRAAVNQTTPTVRQWVPGKGIQ